MARTYVLMTTCFSSVMDHYNMIRNLVEATRRQVAVIHRRAEAIRLRGSLRRMALRMRRGAVVDSQKQQCLLVSLLSCSMV
jgi:hypothetical protein